MTGAIYPKLWNGATAGGSPGGESSVRHLTGRHDTQGPVYLTIMGHNFTAKSKGGFTEVKTEEGGDGWFSSSDSMPFGITVIPANIRGSAVARGKFAFRGVLPDGNLDVNHGIYSSGFGWAYATTRRPEDHGANNGYYNVSRTTDGGRTFNKLFENRYSTGIFDNWAFPANFQFGYNGELFEVQATVEGVTELGVQRQKPRIDGYYRNPDKTWHYFRLPAPLNELGKDYTRPEFVMLLPQIWATWYAEAGELPRLWITLDLGGSWIEQPTTDFFPDLVTTAFATEVAIGSRTPFLIQTGVQERSTLAHFEVHPISLRKLVIRSLYATAGGTGTTITLYDIFTGTTLNQWTYRTTPLDSRLIMTLGQGAWAQWKFESNTTDPMYSHFQTTVDLGATYQPFTPAGAFHGFVAPIGAYRPAVMDFPATNPNLYYVSQVGGAKLLYQSRDLFVTSKKAATVAPADKVLNFRDYDTVNWVGMGNAPAPINSQFPWCNDSRSKPPEWWYDGIAH